jgi:D-alanyl-D-alanine carboxypeptidase/D-alanyl-D-alanine-endopeptidase (penicillin-binding protein 4)
LLACALAVARDHSDRAQKQLARSIDAILSQKNPQSAQWGIEITSLDSGRELYSKNANELFLPASNLKILTTAAAFALVGPDYRFHTTVESASAPDKYGRVIGDLVLVGRGDPNLSSRTLPYNSKTERSQSPTWVLENFADQLVRNGVKQIDGDVVGDDTFYPWEPLAEGWSQDDLQWYYGAPVSALSLNDNMIQLTIMPGEREGEPAFLSFDPWAPYYEIENRTVTAPPTPPGEHKNPNAPPPYGIYRAPGARQIEFSGTIPLGDAGESEQLAIDDPALFAAEALKAQLEKRGVKILGHARALHHDLREAPNIPATEPGRQVLASYDSLPFFEDLRVINKVSQNLHAELALRLMGKVRGGDGSLESGLGVEEQFLMQAGITPQEYSLHDGSGLSRQDLVAPAAMVKLLRYAAAQPWAAQFQQTLPVAGVDGSLNDRFKNSPAAGHVQAKTGGMDHVKSLSGYATTLSGERIAFSILLNNYSMTDEEAHAAIDQIVNAIVGMSGTGGKKKKE